MSACQRIKLRLTTFIKRIFDWLLEMHRTEARWRNSVYCIHCGNCTRTAFHYVIPCVACLRVCGRFRGRQESTSCLACIGRIQQLAEHRRNSSLGTDLWLLVFESVPSAIRHLTTTQRQSMYYNTLLCLSSEYKQKQGRLRGYYVAGPPLLNERCT